MKDQRPQYPASLFWTGVALSILRSFLWLVVSTVLLIIGRTNPWCGMAGLALLVLVVAVAMIKQLSYRHTVLHSDTPEFDDWQAAMLSPDWEKHVKAMVERAMNDDIEAELEGLEEDEHDGDNDEAESEGDDSGDEDQTS